MSTPPAHFTLTGGWLVKLVMQMYGFRLTINRSQVQSTARAWLHNDGELVVHIHLPQCQQSSLLCAVIKPGAKFIKYFTIYCKIIFSLL